MQGMDNGLSKTTYDYTNQAWVVDGKYQACSHPETMDCKCFGRLHAGEIADLDGGKI